jgi:hypothetical protein
MDDEKKPELLIEKLSRIRIRPRDTLLLSLVGSIVMIIISIVFGVVRILLGPYGQAISIYLWLSGSGYIDEFEYDIEKNGLFKFDVRTATHNNDITIRLLGRGGPVQVIARRGFDPALLANIISEGNERLRQRLQMEIDAVLANVSGWSSFVDDNGDPCSIEEMRAYGIEYRIYPDNFSQHEVMNAVLDVDRALYYVQSRFDEVSEDFRTQM